MAIPSAILAITSAKRQHHNGTPFGATMIKVVIPTATKQMAITSANKKNIKQMVTTSPSTKIKQATGYNTSQYKTKLQTQKGNMAITSANNIKLPKNHWQ